MKLRVNRQELADALAVVSTVAATRTPKEVLKCILVRACADHLELEATDLEVSIRCIVSQVEVEAEGAILVGAEKLAAIVRESADDLLDIESDENHCHVRGADAHFQIYLQDAKEFPAVGEMSGQPDFEVASDVLHKLAERTVFAAARENTRYAINGVLWERSGKTITLVATDGRRLAKAVGEIVGKADGDAVTEAIVPSKAMTLIQRLFGESDQKVGVKITANQIQLRTDKAAVSAALVEGQFPKYRDVVPNDSDKTVRFKTPEMLSAVRRSALLTNEESRGVRFTFGDGELTLSSRAPQQGEARITMPIEYTGEPLEIGFNPIFLLDVLRVVHTDDLILELKESNRPGLMKCGSDYVYVIMPVNLS